MPKVIGMDGNVTFGAAVIPVTEWSCAYSNDVQEVTDTGTGGWEDRISGVSSAEVTFTAFWNTTGTPLSTAVGIGALATLNLSVAGGAGPSGNAIVSSCTITNPAKSPVQFQCTCVSVGEFTV